MARYILLAVVCIIALCNGQLFPGQTWQRATPESQGMSSALLEDAFQYAGGPDDRRSFCASVHRNGYLLKDEYWAGFGPLDPWIIWSVSKAITSTLIGSAERDGYLHTEDAASDYINEWRGNHDSVNVTLDMLMRHDSGRYYDFFTDFIRSQLQPSQTDFAISLRQQHPPGTLYQYNQMAIQTLERVLRVSLNTTVPEYTEQEMFGPLQFQSDSFWQEKSIVMPIPNDPLLYGGMRTTCLDLARFGHLWLHRGNWNGHRVFTDEFYEKGVNMPPPPRAGRRYHWGGPPNYRANGMGDQFVVFNPEKNLIITRIGSPVSLTFSGSDFVNMVMASFTDGDVGSWDVERDRLDNAMPESEVQFVEFLRSMGVEPGKHGEIQLTPEGLYTFTSKGN